MGFAIRQTQSRFKFQSQDQSYQYQGQVATATAIYKAFAFKTKVTFHNMPSKRNMYKVILLCCKINMHLAENALY